MKKYTAFFSSLTHVNASVCSVTVGYRSLFGAMSCNVVLVSVLDFFIFLIIFNVLNNCTLQIFV